MNKKKTILMQSLIGLLPIIYLLSIWNALPATVPLHYNSEFKPDNYGSKGAMLAILLFMFATSVGTSLLVLNLDKIDPKKRYNANTAITIKISWALVIFLALISAFIVYVTEQSTHHAAGPFPQNYFVALIALLFVVLGNFMNSIKPNYFVGIRTPWTLEDEDNWRLTHRLGSKIWFFGGLVMFVLVLFLPPKHASLIVPIFLVPIAGVPIVYSYYLFRQKQRKS